MEIQFFCPRWGSENLSWDFFLNKAADAGYNGIEFAIGREVSSQELDEVWNTAAKLNMRIIAQHFDTYERDFVRHFIAFEGWFNKIQAHKPYRINSQTGKDYFTFDQNEVLIDVAAHFSLQMDVPVFHETHRNKFSFAAHITKTYLEKIPGLKLTLDISHWICTAESFLEDQAEAVNLAALKTEHIHARIGYPEGPQVPDPRVPEWQEAMDVHLAVWDKIASRKKCLNETLTISPEFGPAPYMVHLPGTNKPRASQWDINEYIMNLLKKRYKSPEFRKEKTLIKL